MAVHHFWCWFVFIQFERSLWLTVVIWHGFLAILKICLNNGSTRAGKAKFAGAFSTFQDFNGPCTMSLCLLFFCYGPKNIQQILYFFFFMRGKDVFVKRGKHALIWSLPVFWEWAAAPKTWVMSTYANFLTCKIFLYSFTCTLLLFLSGLRLNWPSGTGHNLCIGCQEAV